MLLELATSAPLASELGFLLHKTPPMCTKRHCRMGPYASSTPKPPTKACTMALWLDVDPVGLVRRAGDIGFAVAQYVNDRSYVASSFLSVAIGQAFSTALAGRCKDHPERVSEL